MADANRKKTPLYTSDRGVFSFPHLNKADTKWDPEGVYHVSLVQPLPKAQGLIDTVNEAIDAQFAKKLAELKEKGEGAKVKKLKRHFPYQDECDKEGDPTGNIKVRFKVNAIGRNKDGTEEWSNQPALFDASGIPTDKVIYSGSEGKISYQIVPYFNAKDVEVGVTLRLKAVQVIKLVTAGQRGASGYGFSNEADEDDVGYDEDDTSSSTPAAADAEGEDEDDVDF